MKLCMASAMALGALAVLGADGSSVPTVTQVFRSERFVRTDENLRFMQPCDAADWIWIRGETAADKTNAFVRFRRAFKGQGTPLVFDVTTDSRYVLKLDGKVISRGPHNGLVNHWYYQTYRVEGLEKREHVLEATVFVAGLLGPSAVKSSGHGGFLLKAEGDYDALLTTGTAPWEGGRLTCTHWRDFGNSGAFGCAAETEAIGTGWLDEVPAKWELAVIEQPRLQPSECGSYNLGRVLFPTEREDQLERLCRPGHFRAARANPDRSSAWNADDVRSPMVAKANALLSGGRRLVVPAETTVRLLWDLEDYFCAYPELVVSGGKSATVAWCWLESLWSGEKKGERGAFVGKSSEKCVRDVFRCDGRAKAAFTVPWWRSGRWCELVVKTAGEPLEIEWIGLKETRYPFKSQASFVGDDPELEAIQRMCERGLENCLHEIVMDCPYYEQQMYPGDTRVQLKILDRLGDARTDRLARFATAVFDFGRRDNGWVPMQCPSRYEQFGVAWTLGWLMMLGDRAEAGAEVDFLKAHLPGLRATLAAVEGCETADGLLGRTPGWTFFDHVSTWHFGNPPSAQSGSAPINLFYALALKSAAKVESACGHAEMAELLTAKARRLADRVVACCWDEQRALVADDATKTTFSEHAQALAILTEALDPQRQLRVVQALASDPKLTRASVYFSHYLFEAYFKARRADLFFSRLALWRDYVRCGLKTPLESPPNPDGRDARSDCHGWGAHPLYHLHANVAGVKGLAPDGKTVTIAPQPGPLKGYCARTPTPKGLIVSDLKFSAAGEVTGTITLPPGLAGNFEWRGETLPLKPGSNKVVTSRTKLAF